MVETHGGLAAGGRDPSEVKLVEYNPGVRR